MPELRQNLATREWVIIATERARRPEQFVQPSRERVEDRPAHDPACPFCTGNEELDLERLRLPDDDSWKMRVVANRFPALRHDRALERTETAIYRNLTGVGHHEIVVESRRHNTCPAIETIEEIELTLRAFQMRSDAFHDDPRVEQVVCFKNHGPSSGASLLHPHAQILALPIVPNTIRVRAEESRRHYDDYGTCAICRIRETEEQQQTRIVYASAHFTVFVPYAAFSPFHLYVVPRRHSAHFADASPAELRDLALALSQTLRRLYVGLNDPDYNYIVRCSPERERGSRYLHWYLEIVPRVNTSAGFELGSGMYINTALPEESARFLREVPLT